MPRGGVGRWSTIRADKVQEKLQVHPCQVACAPLYLSRQMLFWSVQEDEVSLARRESRADFPEVSVQLLDPSEWKLTAYGGSFREENIGVLEARSILYAVRYVENSYPPGPILILSDNLALVLALCNGRSNIFAMLSVMRQIFCVWFLSRLVSYRSGGYRQR